MRDLCIVVQFYILNKQFVLIFNNLLFVIARQFCRNHFFDIDSQSIFYMEIDLTLYVQFPNSFNSLLKANPT